MLDYRYIISYKHEDKYADYTYYYIKSLYQIHKKQLLKIIFHAIQSILSFSCNLPFIPIRTNVNTSHRIRTVNSNIIFL